DGDADAVELVGEDARLLGIAPAGEVAGQQQHVGPVRQGLEVGPQPSGRVDADMDVTHRRDADHGMTSGAGGWSLSTIDTRLSMRRPGSRSASTRSTARRRSSVATTPCTVTQSSSTVT